MGSWELFRRYIPFYLASMLRQYILKNISNSLNRACGNTTSTFLSYDTCQQPIYHYLCRLQKHFDCSCSCYIVCAIYIDRIIKSGIVVDVLNVRNIAALALVLAIKYLEDIIYPNRFYADTTRLPLKIFLQFETKVLKTLSYALYVTPTIYHRYVHILIIPPTKKRARNENR